MVGAIAASFFGGPPGWVLAGTLVGVLAGSYAIVASAAEDVLHVQSYLAREEFLMAEHMGYLNALTYLDGREIADQRRDEFLAAPILAETWEHGAAN